MKRIQKRRLWLAVEVGCLTAFLLILVLLIVRLTDQSGRRQEEQRAEALFQQLEQSPTPTAGPSETVQPVETAPEVLPELQPFLSKNPDFVGMIAFEKQSMYVCQGDDNFYYASHRLDGSETPAGMIFMDCRNALWPADENTILYGHNMQDGTRFGKLPCYADMEYLLNNSVIRFASLYEIRSFAPISVFYTSVDASSPDYFDFARTCFADTAEFDEYIAGVTARSIHALPANVHYGDRLLTLVTCSETYDGGRLVIVCRELQ